MNNNISDFDPIKTEKTGVRAKRVIWSSKTLQKAIQGLEKGQKLVANPFYDNDIKLLKGDLVFQRTDEEIQEWLRCQQDIIYFVEKYCKLMTPKGIQHVTLREYQKEYLKHLSENRLSIMLSVRQAGKTTTSGLFMLHYICFNVDKNALVLGDKKKTAIEILDKTKKIFQELPFFLRPGVIKWNESEIVMDNGCRIMAEATTVNSGLSFTFHCVLADEFAHIRPNIVEKFYTNIFPTITAAKARFMISSTQNGYNLFYRLFKAAEVGENEYKAFKVTWEMVPEWNEKKQCWEKRDEAWRKAQIANYGSEEAFNSQFSIDFDIKSSTLISQKHLKKIQDKIIKFEEKNLPGIPLSSYYMWDPNFEPQEELKKNYIIITADLAEGGGGDYTVFSFYVFEKPGEESLRCIGYYRSNDKSLFLSIHSLLTLICMYINQEKLLLSFEKNTYGDIFLHNINILQEKDAFISSIFDSSVIVKYYNEKGSSYTSGIKITPGNKNVYCLLFKESFEKNRIINNSVDFYNEITCFTNSGSSYKACFGHDDLVMSAIQLEFVKQTIRYKIIKGEFDTLSDIEIPESDIYYNPYEILQEGEIDFRENYINRLLRS